MTKGTAGATGRVGGGIRARRLALVGAMLAAGMVTMSVAPAQAAETRLLAPDGAQHDRFGGAVAASGDRVVVGTLDDDAGSDSGAVHVFEADGAGGWIGTKLTASDGHSGQFFGYAVAIAGDRVVVGAPGDDEAGSRAGAAYVYEPDGAGGWTETKLLAADGDPDDSFGRAVAATAGRVVVGAQANEDVGAAYVYEADGTGGWTETKLTASDGGTSDLFGSAVATSGGRVVVGAPGVDVSEDPLVGDEGAVYVFEEDGAGGWTETKLTAADGGTDDEFGASVATAGDRVVVGAWHDHSNGAYSGSVYVHDATGPGSWSQTRIVASDHAPGDRFGHSVAVVGDRVLVGAPRHVVGDVGTGSAYVLQADGVGGWTQFELHPQDLVQGDNYGHAVAMTADRVVIGAPRVDVNGDASGAAYVFDVDDVPPTLAVPASIEVEASSPSGAEVTYVASATDDTDPSPTVTCTPSSGALFPIGNTTVDCTATDQWGNSATGDFLITVTVGPSTFDGFADGIGELELPHGTATSLVSKIDAARQLYADGEFHTAIAILESLINQVDAMEGQKLDPSEAEQIRSAAETLIAAIAD